MRWSGRKVQEYTAPIAEIDQWIPYFTRTSGWVLVDEGVNEYLDVIIRQPLASDSEYINKRLRIPVCTVTKQYNLFQHRDVFNALKGVLEQIVRDLNSLRVSLSITEHGEQMWIRFVLANFQLNEMEQYPMLLEVSSVNTVVPGKTLEARLSWYEPEFQTRIPYGMFSTPLLAGTVETKITHKRKKKDLDTDIFSRKIHTFLTTHLASLAMERDQYRRWKNAEVSRQSLACWVNTTVAKKWTYSDAVRVYQIVMQGWDVRVKIEEEEQSVPSPSELMSPGFVKERKVPEKFIPAKNAFDVSLILAWIISLRGTITDLLKWTDIPELMDALIAEDEQLRSALR